MNEITYERHRDRLAGFDLDRFLDLLESIVVTEHVKMMTMAQVSRASELTKHFVVGEREVRRSTDYSGLLGRVSRERSELTGAINSLQQAKDGAWGTLTTMSLTSNVALVLDHCDRRLLTMAPFAYACALSRAVVKASELAQLPEVAGRLALYDEKVERDLAHAVAAGRVEP